MQAVYQQHKSILQVRLATTNCYFPNLATEFVEDSTAEIYFDVLNDMGNKYQDTYYITSSSHSQLYEQLPAVAQKILVEQPSCHPVVLSFAEILEMLHYYLVEHAISGRMCLQATESNDKMIRVRKYIFSEQEKQRSRIKLLNKKLSYVETRQLIAYIA